MFLAKELGAKPSNKVYSKVKLSSLFCLLMKTSGVHSLENSKQITYCQVTLAWAME